jgi:hypothetical protein
LSSRFATTSRPFGRVDDALAADLAMGMLREDVAEHVGFRCYCFAEASPHSGAIHNLASIGHAIDPAHKYVRPGSGPGQALSLSKGTLSAGFRQAQPDRLSIVYGPNQ